MLPLESSTSTEQPTREQLARVGHDEGALAFHHPEDSSRIAAVRAASSIRAERHTDKVYRNVEVPTGPPPEAARPAPVPATTPAIDLDRLDKELWRRFEKRLRVERERSGR